MSRIDETRPFIPINIAAGTSETIHAAQIRVITPCDWRIFSSVEFPESIQGFAATGATAAP